jgi:hypothetical protein
MHTAIVISVGLALLLLSLPLGRLLGAASGMAHAAVAFIPLWLIAAAVNMYRGVQLAGYSVSEELPVFLLVFTLPALVALVFWWHWR